MGSRSTWACELKYEDYLAEEEEARSRSTWACELKFWPSFVCDQHIRHAPRERVSWNELLFDTVQEAAGHAPRERVSWNATSVGSKFLSSVTLHVSVWVEIWVVVNTCPSSVVTLHVSVWVEMRIRRRNEWTYVGHAPRERVSWNI